MLELTELLCKNHLKDQTELELLCNIDAGAGHCVVSHVCSVSDLLHKYKQKPEVAADQLESQFEP